MMAKLNKNGICWESWSLKLMRRFGTRLWNRQNPGGSKSSLSRNYSLLVSIYLRSKILGETVHLTGPTVSDTYPLARGRQETLTDIPNKTVLNVCVCGGCNHSMGNQDAFTCGGMNRTLEKSKWPLVPVSQGGPHFYFTNTCYLFFLELSIGQYWLYLFICFWKEGLVNKGY